MNLLLKARVLLMRFSVKARVLEMLLVFVLEALVVVSVPLVSLSPQQQQQEQRHLLARQGAVWASGAKGLDFQFVAAAPVRRCSGPFS